MKRDVKLFSDGSRRVVHGDRECWSAYFIYPRELILGRLRKLMAHTRQRGSKYSYSSHELWEMLPTTNEPMPGGYGGPGQSFSREPTRMRSSRRFIVLAQSGGLDV